MAVGRRLVRLIERAHAHEGHQRARACEVAPDRRMAMRAAHDLLTQTAFRRGGDGIDGTRQQAQPLGFDQGVQGKRCASFALAPAAVAAMHGGFNRSMQHIR